MAKQQSTIPEATLAQFAKLAATIGEEVKGATMPYLSMNGNMFAFFSKDGVFHLRLPEEQLLEVMAKHKTSRTMQFGAVMKEYVDIPASLLSNTRQMNVLMKASHAYAKSLKPKPTKRK